MGRKLPEGGVRFTVSRKLTVGGGLQGYCLRFLTEKDPLIYVKKVTVWRTL
jgi:hypothetical protein